jgi:hypothetical protein
MDAARADDRRPTDRRIDMKDSPRMGAESHRGLMVIAYTFSALNILLALDFFPVVPCLGWLNFGHGNWATAWIPDFLLLSVLPAGYYLYWHFWFAFSVPAILASFTVYKRTGEKRARLLSVLNVATIAMFWAVRLALAVLAIRPDIV